MSATDGLICDWKESSANNSETVFKKNAKVSWTLSIRTCRKLYGSVPIVQKKLQQMTEKLNFFTRYVHDIVCTVKGNHLDHLHM